MHSPALAIGWSVWARHRALHATVLATLPICAILYRIFGGMVPNHLESEHGFLQELPLTIVPLVFSLIWVLYAFAQTENDAKKGFTGFPVRMFALPVRTRFLVTCHMAYGVAALLLLHLAWVKFVFAPVGVHFELRWPLLLLALAMVWFQATIWGLASFPWIRAAVLGVGGLLLGPLIAIASLPEMVRHDRASTYVLWTLAALPVAYFSAIAAVRAERLGGWQPWDRVGRLAHRLFDMLLFRPRPFSSGAKAIAWLEWRRKGWLSAVWLAVSIAGAACLLPVMAASGMLGLPTWFAVAAMFPWPVWMGGLLGNFLARPDLTGPVELPPFHAIKPITNGQILAIKLRVAGGVTVLGWLLAVPLIWGITFWPKWREMWVEGDLLELSRSVPGKFGIMFALLIFTIIMTWKAMTETLCLGLTGNSRVITLRLMSEMFLFFAAGSIGIWFFHRPYHLAQWQTWLYLGLGLYLAAKLGRFFRSFALVHRRALVAQNQFRQLLALWSALALGVLGAVVLLWFNPALPHLLLLATAAWLWPAGELAQSVINLSANRHR